MSASLNSSARLFLVYWDDKLVAMNSILAMPSGNNKFAFRVHRLIVLPDYQNLNLGTKINEAIAEMYIEKGDKLYIRTSHIRLYKSLVKNPRWVETSHSKIISSPNSGTKYMEYDTKRICYSFEFRGEDYATKPILEVIVKKTPEITEELKNKLLALKKKNYVIVIYGSADKTDDFEQLVKLCGIRTEVLYIKSNNKITMKKNI